MKAILLSSLIYLLALVPKFFHQRKLQESLLDAQLFTSNITNSSEVLSYCAAKEANQSLLFLTVWDDYKKVEQQLPAATCQKKSFFTKKDPSSSKKSKIPLFEPFSPLQGQPHERVVLYNRTAEQVGVVGKPYLYQLPSRLFPHFQGDNITYSMVLANGSSLPSFLLFDDRRKLLYSEQIIGEGLYRIRLRVSNSEEVFEDQLFRLITLNRFANPPSSNRSIVVYFCAVSGLLAIFLVNRVVKCVKRSEKRRIKMVRMLLLEGREEEGEAFYPAMSPKSYLGLSKICIKVVKNYFRKELLLIKKQVYNKEIVAVLMLSQRESSYYL